MKKLYSINLNDGISFNIFKEAIYKSIAEVPTSSSLVFGVATSYKNKIDKVVKDIPKEDKFRVYFKTSLLDKTKLLEEVNLANDEIRKNIKEDNEDNTYNDYVSEPVNEFVSEVKNRLYLPHSYRPDRDNTKTLIDNQYNVLKELSIESKEYVKLLSETKDKEIYNDVYKKYLLFLDVLKKELHKYFILSLRIDYYLTLSGEDGARERYDFSKDYSEHFHYYELGNLFTYFYARNISVRLYPTDAQVRRVTNKLTPELLGKWLLSKNTVDKGFNPTIVSTPEEFVGGSCLIYPELVGICFYIYVSTKQQLVIDVGGLILWGKSSKYVTELESFYTTKELEYNFISPIQVLSELSKEQEDNLLKVSYLVGINILNVKEHLSKFFNAKKVNITYLTHSFGERYLLKFNEVLYGHDWRAYNNEYSEVYGIASNIRKIIKINPNYITKYVTRVKDTTIKNALYEFLNNTDSIFSYKNSTNNIHYFPPNIPYGLRANTYTFKECKNLFDKHTNQHNIYASPYTTKELETDKLCSISSIFLGIPLNTKNNYAIQYLFVFFDFLSKQDNLPKSIYEDTLTKFKDNKLAFNLSMGIYQISLPELPTIYNRDTYIPLNEIWFVNSIYKIRISYLYISKKEINLVDKPSCIINSKIPEDINFPEHYVLDIISCERSNERTVSDLLTPERVPMSEIIISANDSDNKGQEITIYGLKYEVWDLTTNDYVCMDLDELVENKQKVNITTESGKVNVEGIANFLDSDFETKEFSFTKIQDYSGIIIPFSEDLIKDFSISDKEEVYQNLPNLVLQAKLSDNQVDEFSDEYLTEDNRILVLDTMMKPILDKEVDKEKSNTFLKSFYNSYGIFPKLNAYSNPNSVMSLNNLDKMNTSLKDKFSSSVNQLINNYSVLSKLFDGTLDN